MIYARPGETYTGSVTGAPDGLVGDIQVGLQADEGGELVVAYSAAGITENVPGFYVNDELTAPDSVGTYFILWRYPDPDDEGEWIVVDEPEALVVTYTPPNLEPEAPDDGPMTPTVADVARHLRARTKDHLGNEVGTFTDNTRPTAAQVLFEIPNGVRTVTSKIGVEICEGGDVEKQEALYQDAKNHAAMATAMVIERSYFPEQIGTDRSPYNAIRDELKDGMKTLIEAVAEHCGGGGGESVGGGGQMPSGGFPPATGIGEMTW